MKPTGLITLLVALAALPAHAADITLPLEPSTTTVGYTVYALGFIPIPATYQSFRGTIRLDPAHPEACRVQVTIDVGSLHMADPDRVKQALAPDMLDVARYPTMNFAGACQGNQTVGTLTLHGVTRPIALSTIREDSSIDSTGRLDRHDYGIDGLPHLVGATIRLRFTTKVPDTLAHQH
jgi:polyisoprenoid-binding protein YceI